MTLDSGFPIATANRGPCIENLLAQSDLKIHPKFGGLLQELAWCTFMRKVTTKLPLFLVPLLISFSF